jgi:hypothetical protein
LFQNVPAKDFHLTATSPAVDAGIDAWAPADDLDGRLRGDPPDIGPYEYESWEPSAWIYLPYVGLGGVTIWRGEYVAWLNSMLQPTIGQK